MPFVTTRPDDSLAGIYRTQALADAAAAVPDSGVTATQGAILDADIPAGASPRESWWVRAAPAVVGVNASVAIQYGTSGKGFRLEFSTGATGADGNGWTVATAGTGITFDADAGIVQLPEPGGMAVDYIALLSGLSGTYQFTADYLTGTEGATDLAALGSLTWQPADGASGEPTFAGGVDALPERMAVFDAPLPLYTPRAAAAKALQDGLHTFREFVLAHAGGVPAAAVRKVNRFLHQKRRTNRMAFENNVEIAGVAVNLTDAQFIAWATYCRFGPLDTSAVTSLGRYNPEGLFDIFERAEDPTVLDPTGPITWVGLDTTQWTADAQGNANAVPNRLNVAQIAPVLGDAPSQYENVDDLSWLRS